jgi:hypothetical protein
VTISIGRIENSGAVALYPGGPISLDTLIAGTRQAIADDAPRPPQGQPVVAALGHASVPYRLIALGRRRVRHHGP